MQDNTGRGLGKTFTWLTWLAVLAVFSLLFDELIATQQNPNQSVDSFTNRNGVTEVKLKQNRYGHYVTNGEINGETVTFLLDTGATQVSVPGDVAERLALSGGRSYWVNTANGQVKVYQTTLSELRIGDIILYNVAAHINPAMQAEAILLGMSALKRIEFTQAGKTLTLKHYNE